MGSRDLIGDLEVLRGVPRDFLLSNICFIMGVGLDTPTTSSSTEASFSLDDCTSEDRTGVRTGQDWTGQADTDKA